MARQYRRDARGRFAGGGGTPATTGGSIKARASAGRSRTRLAAMDTGDRSFTGSLSRRSQKGAVTRTRRAASAAGKANTISMKRQPSVGGVVKRSRTRAKPSPSRAPRVRRQQSGGDLLRRWTRMDNRPQPLNMILTRKQERSLRTQAMARAFRDSMAGPDGRGLRFRRFSGTPEGQQVIARNYGARPRYSTRQRIRPQWAVRVP